MVYINEKNIDELRIGRKKLETIFKFSLIFGIIYCIGSMVYYLISGLIGFSIMVFISGMSLLLICVLLILANEILSIMIFLKEK